MPAKPPVDPCTFETAARALLIVGGAAQGLGTILTLVGLPTHAEAAKDGPAVDPGAAGRSAPRVGVVPTPMGLSVSLSSGF